MVITMHRLMVMKISALAAEFVWNRIFCRAHNVDDGSDGWNARHAIAWIMQKPPFDVCQAFVRIMKWYNNMAIDGEKFNDISDSIVLQTNSYKNAFHNAMCTPKQHKQFKISPPKRWRNKFNQHFQPFEAAYRRKSKSRHFSRFKWNQITEYTTLWIWHINKYGN